MTVADLHDRVSRLLPKGAVIRGFLELVNLCVERIREKGVWTFYQAKGEILVVDAYSTGTVSVTQDSGTVTGSGTTFTAAMVGRKFTAGGNEVYEVATYVGATEITISPVYQGATGSGLSYEIYQDAYELPADCDVLIGWWDATNRCWVRPVSAVEVGDKGVLTQVGAGYPYLGAQFGVGPNGVPEVVFYPAPKSRALVPVWYGRRPVAVDALGDSVDLPAKMDTALVQGMRWLCGEGMGDVSSGQLEHWRNRFYDLVKQRWVEDQRLLGSAEVKVGRADGGGSREWDFPLTIGPIEEE